MAYIPVIPKSVSLDKIYLLSLKPIICLYITQIQGILLRCAVAVQNDYI